MLTIRLQRVGSKNDPAFRIVLAEKHRSAKKKSLEILGHYNPSSKDFAVKDGERLKHWIAQRVELSPTVRNLFVEKGYVQGAKVQAWKPKRKASEAAAAEGGKKPAEQKTGNKEAPTSEAVGVRAESAGTETAAPEVKQEEQKN